MKIVPNNRWIEIDRRDMFGWVYITYKYKNIISNVVYDAYTGEFDRFYWEEPPIKHGEFIPKNIII